MLWVISSENSRTGRYCKVAISSTAIAIASIAATVISAGAGVYASTRPTPTLPTPSTPVVNPPPVALAPPQSAPIAQTDTAEGKARAAAARKQRDLESRSSNASTILTTPLGVSTPSGNVQSSVLGR